jgi:hypothetical protein
VELIRQNFALRQERVAILLSFQDFMKSNFVKIDSLIVANLKNGTFTPEHLIAAMAILREVNNKYREIAFALSAESQEILNGTLAFIEGEANSSVAFEQLQNLPALYQGRVRQDLSDLFK